MEKKKIDWMDTYTAKEETIIENRIIGNYKNCNSQADGWRRNNTFGNTQQTAASLTVCQYVNGRNRLLVELENQDAQEHNFLVCPQLLRILFRNEVAQQNLKELHAK